MSDKIYGNYSNDNEENDTKNHKGKYNNHKNNGELHRQYDNKYALDRVEKELNRPRLDNNQVNYFIDDSTIVEAMVRPDLHRGISFPSLFNTPGTPIHRYNTLTLKTNSNGVCWVQVNFGQYLGKTSFVPSGTTFDNNQVVPFGRSNVFVSDPEYGMVNGVQTKSDVLDGTTTYNNVDFSSKQFKASSVMKEEIEMYNAVKSGPCAAWYDFTGRIDISSGVVTAGINYTFSKDESPNEQNAPNGFLPDPNYITLKSIEDCPYKQSGSVLDSLHACFIPHDQSVLDLKDPKAGNHGVQQRFFLIITGAPANKEIGQLKLAMNHDGKPNSKYADNISTRITQTPSLDSLKTASDWLITNNKVIRVAKDQGYGMKRFDHL